MINFIKIPTDDITQIAQELAFKHGSWTDMNFKYPRGLDEQEFLAAMAERFVRQLRDEFCDIARIPRHRRKLAKVFFMTFTLKDERYKLFQEDRINQFTYLVSEMLELGIESLQDRVDESVSINKHRTRFDSYGNAYSFTDEEIDEEEYPF